MTELYLILGSTAAIVTPICCLANKIDERKRFFKVDSNIRKDYIELQRIKRSSNPGIVKRLSERLKIRKNAA
jgi:hypothetical protein